MTKEIELWMELNMLQQRYVNALDNDELEEWPDFFTDECRYEIIPKENFDGGLPAPIIYCTSREMLRDRVVSLRHANIFESHTYRHMLSGLVLKEAYENRVKTTSSYVVAITGQAGETAVYQAGCYHDTVEKVDGQWRYRRKTAVYDTLRVQTLLATPI